MIGNVFLTSTFDLLDGFGVPEGIVSLIKILMISGVFFGGLLVLEFIRKKWNHESYLLRYQEKNPPKRNKKDVGYILWRGEQITKNRKKQLEKWEKACKKRRRKSLALGMLVFLCLTELFPSGTKENSVKNVKENQAVLYMWYNISGCFGGSSYLTVIDAKGRWKKTSLYGEEIEKVPGWKECQKEKGFEITPEFLNAILASDAIPFQKRRLILSRRNVESAINVSDSPEKYYCIPYVDSLYSRGSFYQITGDEVSDIKRIGKSGFYREMYFEAEKMPLYFVFWQTCYYATDIYELVDNIYLDQMVMLLMGIFLTRIMRGGLKKNRMKIRMG